MANASGQSSSESNDHSSGQTGADHPAWGGDPVKDPGGAARADERWGEVAVGKLVRARRIAVVGLSDNPDRDSYHVARYLLSVGRQVVPVNPNLEQVLGLRCYRSLAEVPGKIDLVDVFRRPEACAGVAHDAVQIGAEGLWLQLGVISPEARRIAAGGALWFVEDRCLMVEHRRLTRPGDDLGSWDLGGVTDAAEE